MNSHILAACELIHAITTVGAMAPVHSKDVLQLVIEHCQEQRNRCLIDEPDYKYYDMVIGYLVLCREKIW